MNHELKTALNILTPTLRVSPLQPPLPSQALPLSPANCYPSSEGRRSASSSLICSRSFFSLLLGQCNRVKESPLRRWLADYHSLINPEQVVVVPALEPSVHLHMRGTGTPEAQLHSSSGS